MSFVMQEILSHKIRALPLPLTLALDPRMWLLEHSIRKAEKQSNYLREDPKHLKIDSISEKGYEGREKKKKQKDQLKP